MRWRSRYLLFFFLVLSEGVRYRHDTLLLVAGFDGGTHDTGYGHSMAYTDVELPKEGTSA